MKQQDVASHIGVSTNYYAQIERGARPARQLVLEQLATLYSLEVADLYERSDFPPLLQSVVNTLSANPGNDITQEMHDLVVVAASLPPQLVSELHKHAILLSHSPANRQVVRS